MLKWFNSFNRTLVSKGMDIAELVYGSICLFIGLIILNVGGYCKNNSICSISGMFGIAGMILIILSVWNLIKNDIKDFFKEVKNNRK